MDQSNLSADSGRSAPTLNTAAEIHVADSDIKNLKIVDRSDLFFAFIYAILFLSGLVLTLVSI